MMSREADPLAQPLPRVSVARPTLERRLDDVEAAGVGLIVASAGSGKSVLLRQWTAARPDLRVASLGLRACHDDAVVLARDLLASIRVAAPGVDPAIEQLVKSGGAQLGEPFIAELLNELANVPGPLVIVFEDVHILTSPALVADLGTVVTHLPANVRAAVTTRRDLAWNLRPLRLEGRLVELRGADLAFTIDEARQLLVEVSGRALADEQVATLVDRTDGWAAGLQLAAISLQSAKDVAEFLDAFAGSDRLIADYLVEEVIERQTPELQYFLLRTSVLDELSPEACDAVTGMGNSRAMLDEITSRSLFLVPLDGSRERFRYHHLFADVLANRLRASDPGGALEAHVAAARWFVDHGHRQDAIPHLLAAGDHRQAFEMITHVGHRFFEEGKSATLVHWLSQIDDAAPDMPPAVGVNLLAAHLAADQGPAAAETYRRLTKRTDLTDGERATSDALYAILVFRGLPPDVVLKTADDVLAAVPLLDDSDVVDFLGVGGLDSIHVMAEYAAAIAHFHQGDLRESRDRLERALNLPGMRYPVWRIYTLSSLALVRAWVGHTTEALQIAASAIDEARALGVAGHAGVTHAHMAAALAGIDRLDTDLACTHLTQADLQNRRRTSSTAYFDLQRALNARFAILTEGPDRALDILRAPAASAQEPAVLVHANAALLAQLLLGNGDLSEVRVVLDLHPDDAELMPARIDFALAQHDSPSARTLLDGWEPEPGDLRSVIRHLLREAAAAEAEGDHRMAKVAFGQARAQAEAEELRWPFLASPAAWTLLTSGSEPGSRLINEPLLRTARLLAANVADQTRLAEPLTERELTVLEYLPARLRNQEIATELYVSVNTLKSHLRNIYRKLEVADRDEAIAKAREIGLL